MGLAHDELKVENLETDDEDHIVTLNVFGREVKVAIPRSDSYYGNLMKDWRLEGCEKPYYLNFITRSHYY